MYTRPTTPSTYFEVVTTKRTFKVRTERKSAAIHAAIEVMDSGERVVSCVRLPTPSAG